MPETISASETAGTQDTSEADLLPPGADGHLGADADAEAEIQRLDEFLRSRFPEHMDLTNRQVPESPVEVAIRLLSGMASIIPGQSPRCAEAYCNKPNGHTDAHGWIHYQ